MQYVRYIASMLPVVALVGAEGAGVLGKSSMGLRWSVAGAITFQAALTLSAFVGDVPTQISRALDRDAQEAYLRRQVTVYSAEQWINQHTPRDSGVILFEETRGYFLDRPYLWGNELHSLYIPYRRDFKDGADMARWFFDHGYHYGIINLTLFPPKQNAAGQMELRQAIAEGTVPRLVYDWYNSVSVNDEWWRRLLGDALRKGTAIVLPEATERGAAVIEFRKRQ